MFLGAACLVVLLTSARADPGGWRWPDEARAASVRIDTKVRFVDDDSRRPNKVQADEIKPPVETDGFYNRPVGVGSGRYPVRNEPQSQRLTHGYERPRPQYSDGTLDSLQFCKCVASPDPSCHSPSNLPKACSSGMNLCCYKRSNRAPHGESDIFSELEDERPMLLPSYERRPGPFGAGPGDPQIIIDSYRPSGGYQTDDRPSRQHNRVLLGPEGPTGIIGPNRHDNRVLVGPSGPTGMIGPNHRQPDILVGPNGPTGVIGPNHRDDRILGGSNRKPGVLVGPEGPTGVIGPNQPNPGVLVGPGGPTGIIGPNQRNPGVLVGPNGPSGVIGPHDRDNIVHGGHGSNKRNPGVLVGPDGPTGVIGPTHRDDRVYSAGSSGFRRPNQPNRELLVGFDGPTSSIGVPDRHDWLLVGPDGPTGEIGPNQKQGLHSNQGAESAQVLVGPGGPTGIIGPGGRRGQWQTGPGILVGPGGRTGIIGPGQRLLVGPGGPTGRLGPRGYGQYGF